MTVSHTGRELCEIGGARACGQIRLESIDWRWLVYTVTHWWGKHERNMPEERFGEVLAELAGADQEHPDCWLSHESGWSLSYSRERRLVFENVEFGKTGEERHMMNIPPNRVVDLWTHLAIGDIGHISSQPWLPWLRPVTASTVATSARKRTKSPRPFRKQDTSEMPMPCACSPVRFEGLRRGR